LSNNKAGLRLLQLIQQTKKNKLMKKILFLSAFFMLAGLTLSAQSESKAKSCDKPCTHSEKASASASTDVSKAVMAAEKAENIEMKTCEKSGNVSFYRKDVCEHSGKVSYTEVEYMDATGEFVVKAENTESSVENEKKSCSSSKSASESKSGCCSSKSAAASAKGSCGSKATKASSGCCSSKSKSAKASCGTKS